MTCCPLFFLRSLIFRSSDVDPYSVLRASRSASGKPQLFPISSGRGLNDDDDSGKEASAGNHDGISEEAVCTPLLKIQKHPLKSSAVDTGVELLLMAGAN